MIHPTWDNEKSKYLVRYNDKKGITIAPALLIRVVNERNHTSFDKPLYGVIILVNI